MFEVRQTEVFSKWLRKLRDHRAVARIAVRVDRLALGHLGDVKSIGDGVSELRIHYGPGYRVYFVKRNQVVIILLCGGDKGSQDLDIINAKVMAKRLNEDETDETAN